MRNSAIKKLDLEFRCLSEASTRSLKMFSLRILKSLDPFSVGVSSYRGKHSSILAYV